MSLYNINKEKIFKFLNRHKIPFFAFCIFVSYMLLALLAQCNMLVADWYKSAKGSEHIAPCAKYLLGTDFLGRSVLKKIIKATQTAMSIGTIVALGATCIGLLLGCLAGYFGGWIDTTIVWICNVIKTMPSTMLLIAIGFAFEKGMLGLYIGLITVSFADFCLVIRSQAMQHKVKDYIQAATAIGASHMRKIFVHILPNILHTVIIKFSIIFQQAIKYEVVLAYLGIGVSLDQPSWGRMIAEAKTELFYQGHWWEFTFATLAMFFIVLSMNILTNTLRDITDPQLKQDES